MMLKERLINLWKGDYMGEIVITEDRYFKEDWGYLEEYVKICHFLNERYEILEEVSRQWRVPYKEREDRERALVRLKELNQAIQDNEWFFWEKVACSKNIGIRLIFEEFAVYHGFSHLEKRIALFFLCSRISKAHNSSLSRFWIMEVFDIEQSIIKKMGSFSIFDEEKPLIKSGILTTMKEWEWDDYGYKYKLNTKFLNFFCQKLTGVEVEWAKIRKETKEESKVNDIGFVKNPDYSFDDVVLPALDKERMNFFLSTHKNCALKNLGIDKVVKKGKGLTFLFYGPPGTGKSMLAEAIASFMGKKVFVVETSKIVSCWLGETDKNINKMFECVKLNDAVLLLDEADSLLYSRNLASSSYTVRFTNAMLTGLERFDGIAIFTSNMDSLLDEAMERRISLKVKFEVPKPHERASIWKAHMSPDLKLAEGIDFDLLSLRYEFSGGYIKNAIVNAMRRVAFRNSDMMTMEDLIFGAETEKQGMFAKNSKKTIIGFSNRS